MSKFFSALTLGFLLIYPMEVLANGDNKDIELENMLNGEINAGSTGSFGYNLNKMNQELGINTYVHAYTTFDAKKETTKPLGFDSLYYNLFVGVNIKDFLATEVQYENEHGGSEYEVRVGQIDLLLNPLFNLRVGKFLVPIGTFNSYLYPEYITKAPVRPFALREIIPVTWSDIGFQFFGKYEFGIDKNINYSLFMINGLKDKTDLSKAEVSYVGNIRDMRGNNEEEDKSDKGIGGRVGITPVDGLELSLSGYNGS